MTTNAQVISDALGLLGVVGVGESLTAEDGALGLRVMNDMLALWAAHEVDVGYAQQDSTTDDSPILPEHMLAVKYNLAVYCAPHFGTVPNPAVVAAAADAYGNLLRDEQNSRLNPVDLTSAPMGEAFRQLYDITTDN